MRADAVTRRAPGQTLVEYALLIALVAVVVVIVVGTVGVGTQRIYGVIAGALGAKRDATGDQTIVIDTALCVVVRNLSNPAASQTGVWVTGTTNIPVSQLSASSELGISSVSGNGPGGFRYNPLLLNGGADASACPREAVIQSVGGTIAIAPLVLQTVIVTPAPP